MEIKSSKNPVVSITNNGAAINLSLVFDAVIVDKNGIPQNTQFNINNIDLCPVGIFEEVDTDYIKDTKGNIFYGQDKNRKAFIKFRMLPDENNVYYSYTIKEQVKKICKTCRYLNTNVCYQPCVTCMARVDSDYSLWTSK
jgi:hypothetical protein